MDKKLQISFKGTKSELRSQFKMLCAKLKTDMNARVIVLIERDIKKNL